MWVQKCSVETVISAVECGRKMLFAALNCPFSRKFLATWIITQMQKLKTCIPCIAQRKKMY